MVAFFGRSRYSHFSRDATTFATERTLPPPMPSWRAIQLPEPNTPCSSAGT